MYTCCVCVCVCESVRVCVCACACVEFHTSAVVVDEQGVPAGRVARQQQHAQRDHSLPHTGCTNNGLAFVRCEPRHGHGRGGREGGGSGLVKAHPAHPSTNGYAPVSFRDTRVKLMPLEEVATPHPPLQQPEDMCAWGCGPGGWVGRGGGHV